MTGFRLIVAPDTPFTAIETALVGLGLTEGPDDSVTPPMIPGERELAYWTAANGSASVYYSFNPVVRLRVLAVSGADAPAWLARIAERLPLLDTAALRHLLQREEHRDILLGLFAAAELKAAALIGDVEPLRLHRDRTISAAAGRTADALVKAVLEAGAERLAEERRRSPGRSALFPRLGDAPFRREVVAWLVRDRSPVNEDVLGVLRAGLDDADWRVRLAAMLAAVRLGAAEVWQEIRRMELPRTSRDGLDADRRQLLHAARKAALAELAGEPLPAGDDEKTRLAGRLRDAVAGRSNGDADMSLDWIRDWLAMPAEANGR